MKKDTTDVITKILAICIIVSTLLCWRLIYILVYLFKNYSTTILINFLISFPALPLCLAAGIGILLKKQWGYYCIYIASVFSVVGSCIPYIPFILRVSHNLTYRISALLTSNILITAFLVYSHIQLNRENKDNKINTADASTRR